MVAGEPNPCHGHGRRVRPCRLHVLDHRILLVRLLELLLITITNHQTVSKTKGVQMTYCSYNKRQRDSIGLAGEVATKSMTCLELLLL